MSKIFFTSDQHFGDNTMTRLRGFESKDGMNARLIDDWNAVVAVDDIVYLVGDFAFFGSTKVESTLEQLNGRKIFTLGNHDQQLKKALDRNPLLQDEPYLPLREVNVAGQLIVLCHYPIAIWNKDFLGSWHLYGHLHSGINDIVPEFMKDRKCMDVGVDLKFKLTSQSHTTLDGRFAPFSFEEIANIMQMRGIRKIDAR